VLTYVNGTTDVGVRFRLDAADNPVSGRLFEAADLYVAGDDSGVGFLDPGPPLQVGGVNAAAGSSARLIQGTPAWSHYQESFYDSVFSVIANSTSISAPNLADTVNPALGDNDLGAQWDFAGVGIGAAQTFSTTWRFNHFSALDLSAAPTQVRGKTATVTVTARNGDGGPDPGRAVRYAIVGANPGSGVVTTAADGTAAITWTGTNLGTDTLTAFTDLNGNGSRETNEPERTATVTWTAPPPPAPPVPGKSVVVRVVSGTVYIKLAGSSRARATGPPKGFVPFTGAANIPVGSQLDTSKGRVELTSAADTGGVKTQASQFYDGIFQVKQSVPKKKPKKPAALITDLVMKGQIARSQCAPLKGGARAAWASAKKKKKGAKAVLGQLWGSGKGKFRTSGKYSSATVRGTIWLVQDRCEGTLTKVVRGTVQVRDLRRKKTVTVKAGQSYLARAQRAASKRRR
ncbi:MAG TPA: Ig-like domain-containing protein, partial [Baekduia sp.]|nr:Ig-like domain-containing protein [Baekduia sp.]